MLPRSFTSRFWAVGLFIYYQGFITVYVLDM